jgi:hypothetical protein
VLLQCADETYNRVTKEAAEGSCLSSRLVRSLVRTRETGVGLSLWCGATPDHEFWPQDPETGELLSRERLRGELGILLVAGLETPGHAVKPPSVQEDRTPHSLLDNVFAPCSASTPAHGTHRARRRPLLAPRRASLWTVEARAGLLYHLGTNSDPLLHLMPWVAAGLGLRGAGDTPRRAGETSSRARRERLAAFS